jgi:hypothetical protein
LTGISAPSDLEKVFGAADLTEGVLFDIERNGENMYISVQAKQGNYRNISFAVYFKNGYFYFVSYGGP